MAENPRKAAVQALVQFHREKTYSNIAVDNLLKNTDMPDFQPIIRHAAIRQTLCAQR